MKLLTGIAKSVDEKLAQREDRMEASDKFGPSMRGVVPGSEDERAKMAAFRAERAEADKAKEADDLAVNRRLLAEANAGKLVLRGGEHGQIVNEVTGEHAAVSVPVGGPESAPQEVPVVVEQRPEA
ncbi:hypothetical protein KA047_01030 [Candidatus Saccharibacteria bacterium]|nr:hypothetical protein [Candidatus Saccharibacteria bacterium]